MSKRFGRNQRRKMREQIAQLKERAHYAELSDEALMIVRQTVREGIGCNICVTGDATILVALAQRAILAGLHADCSDTRTRAKFEAAAEPHRVGHEAALGFAIAKVQP